MTFRLIDVCKLTRKVGISQMYGSKWTTALLRSFRDAPAVARGLIAFIIAGDFWACCSSSRRCG